MATDISLAIVPGMGGQEGINTQAGSSSPASPRPSVPALLGDKAANRNGQVGSLNGQKLPPAGQADEDSELQRAVSNINSYVQNLQRDLQFRVDLDLGATIISVVDSETKEIIRQLPPEEVIARARRLEELRSSDNSTDGLLLKATI